MRMWLWTELTHMFGNIMTLRRLVGGLLALNLIAIVTAVYNDDCKYLLVSKTEFQMIRNGRYKIMNASMVCSGRQAYKQEGGSSYMYYIKYSEDATDYIWMIGPTLCINQGGMALQDTAASPDKANTRWKESNLEKIWLITGAQVECTLVVGTWLGWSNWSSCSVTCDGGTRSRTRLCQFPGDCIGDARATEHCNDDDCIGTWLGWSSCSVTCDGGTRSRTRLCLGTGDCIGDARATEHCNDADCYTLTNTIVINKDGTLSTGSIVGIVVGTIILLLVVVGTCICCYKKQVNKEIVHGTGQPSLQRSVVDTVAPAGRHPANVGQASLPEPRTYGRAAHGYLGPAYQQQGAPNYPGAPLPPDLHSHPIAPVDNGPLPSYTEAQTNQVFTIA